MTWLRRHVIERLSPPVPVANPIRAHDSPTKVTPCAGSVICGCAPVVPLIVSATVAMSSFMIAATRGFVGSLGIGRVATVTSSPLPGGCSVYVVNPSDVDGALAVQPGCKTSWNPWPETEAGAEVADCVPGGWDTEAGAEVADCVPGDVELQAAKANPTTAVHERRRTVAADRGAYTVDCLFLIPLAAYRLVIAAA
jgi:hypothetical protein